MITLPDRIMAVLAAFMPVFSERIWDWVQVLVTGAILTPKKRTVTSILQATGLADTAYFQNYHRVLNRACWSSLEISKILLQLLVTTFVKEQPLVLGADETLERRRGAKIPHLGCFRDAARSSKKNKVKSFGLRWVSMMVLGTMPWSDRVWALPFLTVLAPGAKSDEATGNRHKTSGDWVRQMLCQVRRWLPTQPLILVVDGGLAALKLAQTCQNFDNPATFVTRLQHNARLFDLPPTERRKRGGRKQVIGQRFTLLKDLLNDPHSPWQSLTVTGYAGKLHTVQIISEVALWHTYGQPPVLGRAVWLNDPTGLWEACVLFATDSHATPQQIIEWFVLRWNLEVTFEEVRAHLGFETQRQWNPLAIARTSPAILGLFSLVTLLAHYLLNGQPLPIRHTAWYSKSQATFSDVLAYVRRYLWTHTIFPRGHSDPHSENRSNYLLTLWEDVLCYAA